MEKVLLLVRHGKSDRVEQDKFSRRFDSNLDQNFLGSLNEAKDYFSQFEEKLLVSSPAIRCQDTLKYLFDNQEPNPVLIEQFIPYHFGDFEEKSDSWVKENMEWYYNGSFKSAFLHPKYGEEGIASQTQRIGPGLTQLLKLQTSTPLILSSHYSVIQVICNIIFLNHDISTFVNGYFDLRCGEFIDIRLNQNGFYLHETNSNNLTLPETTLKFNYL
jgi:broad specificity phosphatase PhoE